MKVEQHVERPGGRGILSRPEGATNQIHFATSLNRANVLLPVLSVEGIDFQEIETLVQAPGIYVEAARMRSWPTKRVNPADPAKAMLGHLRIKAIGREKLATLY